MPPDTTDPEVLDVQGTMDFFQISERTLRRWIKEYGLPHAKLGGLLRFRRAALLEWLAERERQLTPEA